ncbi:MAG: RNA polymerase sporulation sigma factor SigH, partial [[Eubacterium] sulci]|nr:RNA polymerase sporulation sigma factor SigH [[Eubacterium] sulci]
MLADEMNILSDESLVKLAKEGSSPAYELLIDKYKHVAKINARKYYIVGAENEDVIQEAMIGIFKAIRDFDENAGTKFSSFLQLCIDNQIKTAINAAN